MKFTEADISALDEFGAAIDRRAKITMTVKQLVDFHRCLVNYNKVRKKIFDQIMEDQKPAEAVVPVAPAPLPVTPPPVPAPELQVKPQVSAKRSHAGREKK